MSELKNRIQTDLKESMKARNQEVVTSLRGLMAAIKQYEVDTRKDADDPVIISILQKEIKMRRDALQFAIEQKRDDLISQNETEIKLLQEYLGKQLSEEELTEIIRQLISSGMNAIGPVMGALNKNHKGAFEGKKASEIIKNMLG
jgi:uncharacterized protein